MGQCKRIAVKIGTKVITSHDRALDRERMREIVRQVADIADASTEVILVTSGAIGAGMWLMGLKRRPQELAMLQAAASVGQSYLMHCYGEYFKERGYLVGQILLTQEDFNDRARYLNIKHTIRALLAHKTIPVINENDTVATEEIKCGDNDRLSGLVADLCQVDRLVILTDVDGLLDADGRTIPYVAAVTGDIAKLAGASQSDLGTGGMATKLGAIRAVTRAGIQCVIANGKRKDVLLKVMNKEPVGTFFEREDVPVMAKKRWIAYSSKPQGVIMVDAGARDALKKNKSLLASGINGVEGSFAIGAVVSIYDATSKEVGRGMTNYSSRDLAKIKGLNTSAFKAALGHAKGPDEVIHKDNLVVF